MPGQSYQLAEVHDASDGQLFSAALYSEIPSVFATGGERDVQLYSVESELGQAFKAKRIMQFQGHNQRINSLAFNNGQDKLLASGSFSGSIRTWDIEVGKASRALPAAHTNAVTCLSFYNPPKYLLSGSLDTSVRLWDLRKKGAVGIYKGHRDRVTTVCFSPDGEWFVTGGADNQLRLVDMRTGKALKTWQEEPENPDNPNSISGVNFVEFHPTDYMLAANFGKQINIFELENFATVSTLPQTAAMPRTGGFHHDGSCFFNVFEDGFETSAWEPSEKLEHVRCGWNWPVSSTISEDDNALRVLSLGKSSVHLHTVSLAEVKTKRENRPFSPRKTFESKSTENVARENSGENDDDSWKKNYGADVLKSEDIHVKDDEVKVFGAFPTKSEKSPNKKKMDNNKLQNAVNQLNQYQKGEPGQVKGVEPGEILSAPRKLNYEPKYDQHLDQNHLTPSYEPPFYNRPVSNSNSRKNTNNDTLLKYVKGNHSSIDDILIKRINNLDQINAQWSTGDIVSTTRLAISLGSSSAILDLINLILENPSIWSLELVVVLMPQLVLILKLSHKVQIGVGVRALDFVLKSFADVICSGVESAQAGGGNRVVDLQREQREERCKYIRDILKNDIGPIVNSQKHKLIIEQMP